MAGSRLKTALILGPGLLALSLAACGEKGGAQQTAEALSGYETVALPDAPAAPVAPVAQTQGYQLAERAYGLQQAFYDAPPAYGFDYDGRQGLAWETEDDWSMYADPYQDQEVYYYYRPGATRPYFVRDGRYGYGFDAAGTLVALFDTNGRYLDRDRFQGAAPLAGRYYAHGGDLRRAARQDRAPVKQDAWRARAPRLQAAAQPWIRAAGDDSAWRAWRDQDSRREAPPRFKARPQQTVFERDLGQDRAQARAQANRDRDRDIARSPDRDQRTEQAARDRGRQQADEARQARQQQDRQQQARQAARAREQQQQAVRERAADAQRVQSQRDAAQRETVQREAAQRQQATRDRAQRETAQRQIAQRQMAERQRAQQARREPSRSPQAKAERADPAANHAREAAARAKAIHDRPENARRAPGAKPDAKPQPKGGDHDRRDRRD